MANSFFSGALDAIGNQTGFNQDTIPTAISKASQIKVPGSQPSMPDTKDNKYRVEMMTYPNDLLDAQAAQAGGINYIKFFINVQSESKIAKTQAGMIEGAAPNNALMNGIVGKAFSSSGYVKGSAIEGAVTGGALGTMAGGAKGVSDYGSKGVAGLFGSTLGGAAAGAVGGGLLKGGGALVETTVLENFADIKFGQPTKRLKTAIALYMPNQLNVRYSMQWSEDEVDLAAYAAINPAFQKSLEAAQESKLQGNTGTVGGAVGNAIASQVLKKNSGLSSAAKAAANPRKEQIFKGVDFRRFTFEYQFAPRNPQEAATVMNIIYQFKYHMHPEFKDASNFIYVYPSEFDIEYFFGSSQNANINKISSCVLTEMNVNYSPNGVFTTFPDGTPTQINLTLQFTELEALTKERIAVGL